MKAAVMFSRATDEWATPQDLFDALDDEFDFDVDAAASESNHKCPIYFGPGGACEDALTTTWGDDGDTVWLNPPYSRCREFMAKATAEAFHNGVTTVALVPSRTDTRWWHTYVWDAERHTTRPGVEIRFIKGRLKFGGAKAGAPFPSVIVIFRGDA